MKLAVHQPQYLPWIGYFHKIDCADAFVFQDDVQYKRREYQNRSQIKTANGSLKLTVPVRKGDRDGHLLRDVMIHNTKREDWRRHHWESIRHAYGKAEFFQGCQAFFESFKAVYRENWERLVDINLSIIQLIMRELNITTPTVLESELHTADKAKEERIIEVCRQIGADTYLSGSGGERWMDRSKFAKAGIRLEFQRFLHPVYPQLHGDFLPYMSVIDLIFNVGPASLDVIRGTGSTNTHPNT